MRVRGILFDLDATLHPGAGVAAHVPAPAHLQSILTGLKPRVLLGVISNGSSEAQRSKLKTLDIERYFDPILISEEVGYNKPQPEIFRLAIEHWQLPSNQILVVGADEFADIQGAKAAGMLALRVGDVETGSAPSIANVSELENWLAVTGLLR